MRKLLKILAILVFGLIGVGVTFYFVLSSSMPTANPGPKAEALTDRMLQALNHDGYQRLNSLSWTFRGKHHYHWQKSEGWVRVLLPEMEVILDFRTGKHELLSGEIPEKEAFDRAKANFYNDSFWLVAPFKIRDTGTTRGYVDTPDGPGILVTYSSGGVTPGDSYLWVLDENHRPKYWRLWTSNVPIPGLKFEWTGWQQHQGVWFAPVHPGPGPLSVDVTNVVVE